VPSPGGKLVALGPIARGIAQIFRQPKDNITSVDIDQQFGPLQPFRPIGGTVAQPWISQIQPGQNLTYTPRAREKYTSIDLRNASMYDLCRIIIENVEDQVSRMPLNIRLKRKPGESGKDYAKRKPDQAILNEIGARLENPNSEQHRSQFIRMLLDDMLVGDFASVLVRRSAKGTVYDFRAIDGAQIARYFDAYGGTPMPPDPAYAQVWDAGKSGGVGIPWVNLTTDQLIYAMRNLKTYRLYGMSPVEQAITTIMVGDLRLTFQKNYYTDGSIPDAMQIVPTKISPEKIKEAQNVMNAELSGILSKRRQIRLLQGFTDDGKDQIIFPKAELLKDEFDDYVIRVLCYCFGTSPQRLQRVMGMRSGQVNQDAAEKEGLEPWLDWAQSCIWNPMVQRYMGFPDYEAQYEIDADVDPHVQAQIDDLNLRNGSVLIDEVREDRGEMPYVDGSGEKPLVITATGAVPLSPEDQIDHAAAMADAMPKPDPAPNNSKKKVAKRHEARIDPAHETPPRRHARARLESALKKVFHRQKDKAVDEASRLIKKVTKADDDPKRISDEIFHAIEAEFAHLPTEARAALEQAALSGIQDAWLQIEITDTDVISGANRMAAEYASERAAEMVGMKYNEARELVANSSAKWAISETTRDRLREIITNAFEDKTPFSEVISSIRDADIFSDARAEMIARTEISRAQVTANVDAWKKSGVVSKVKWIASGPDPCPICEGNDGKIRELGQKFPSGDTMPLAHPNCYCILIAVLED
jgi:hypothetical protein